MKAKNSILFQYLKSKTGSFQNKASKYSGNFLDWLKFSLFIFSISKLKMCVLYRQKIILLLNRRKRKNKKEISSFKKIIPCCQNSY